MNKKYVIMCDYGLDDACATLLLLDNRDKDDEVDIMPIGGNSEVNVAHRNAHTLLAHYTGNLDKVRIVDTRALSQPYAKLPSIHGEDGLGDCLQEKRSTVPEILYADWIKEQGQAITLISLGPCTVTEDILENKQVELLLIMGGCVAEEPNYHGYEFNHGLDIEAFSKCVKFSPCVVATLDSCRTKRFNFANEKFDESTLLGKMLNRSVLYATRRHEDRCFVYDYIAVSYLVEPHTFKVVKSVDPDGNQINELKSNY